MAKKRSPTTGRRTRKVVRSAKTGRFIKSSAAKRRPDVALTETVVVNSDVVLELARSTKTGRFVKKTTAKRNPKTTTIQRVER
jgi:hypothetical protein